MLRIEEMGIGSSRSPDEASIFLTASVANTGTPSIAKTWTLSALIPGRDPVTARSVYIRPDQPIQLTYADGKTVEKSPEDALYNKTMQPIQNGMEVVGVLSFELPGITPEVARTEGSVFTLSCSDITGKQASYEYKWRGGSPSDLDIYHPGLKPPKLPSSSSTP